MISNWANVIAILIVTIVVTGKADECISRNYGYGSMVCVCNSTYCDSTPRNVPDKGSYRIYESGKSGKRMYSTLGHFVTSSSTLSNETESITLTLHPDKKFQKILGFGGAFTDAASELIQNLTEGAQQHLLEAYFGQNGSRYNLGHVPIGSSDFSQRAYTYVDVKDDRLENFTLQQEDHVFKIPVMQKALDINPELIFASSASSAPEWMKKEQNEYHAGYLKEEYYQTYADYLVKFLHAYRENGLEIWAISPGSDPIDLNGMIPYKTTMSWSAASVADWIANNLGPSIAASQSNGTIILVGDDLRMYVPDYVTEIFHNYEASNYTAGIALHADLDDVTSPKKLDHLNSEYPDKFLIVTENCVGNQPWESQTVQKGDWGRGELYILNIIENLNHWASGYIDSNLALNTEGGPNHVGSNSDAAIIVDSLNNEFYKQPIYYAIAHFSKFITRHSVRIGTETSSHLNHVAFLTPEKESVVIVYNSEFTEKLVIVEDPTEGSIVTTIPPHSIQTIIYKT